MKRLLVIAALFVPLTASATIEVEGQSIEVVDMHLHPGHWSDSNLGGKTFLLGHLPGNLRLYAPPLFEQLLDPYAPHVGIRAQTEWAGVDHAVLLAVYTHHTAGYFTNSELLEVIRSSENNGWAWGLASVNLDDFSDPAIAEQRAEALASYFELARDEIVGIKLAHAHQWVQLDDEIIQPVYDVAAEFQAPVLLHTGFSPFPSSATDREFYDPHWLSAMAEEYSGDGDDARVEFILAHTGQGDARSVEHALDMAETHDNIWIEISALGRPLAIDEDGMPVQTTDHQYPWVLGEILERGLVDRTLFSTDGPQFSGMVQSYVRRIVESMQEVGYTTEQIRAVMAGNFYELFSPTGGGRSPRHHPSRENHMW